MPEETAPTEEKTAASGLAAPPSPVDVATVNASVASLRADVAEASVHLAALRTQAGALKADLAEEKAGTVEIMSDIVRLNQKLDRMAGAFASTQAEVERISRSMATKNDVDRILAALKASGAPPPADAR